MFGAPYSAKSVKNGAPDLMVYNVSGTSFWKVGMLTWCNGIPSFSKVKKGAPKTYRIIMFAGPFSAKSAKKGAPDLMIYNVFGTRFSEVVFLNWSQWKVGKVKSEKQRSRSLENQSSNWPPWGQKSKKRSIWKPNRPADGTRFSEVVFSTWSQCFFTFPKVKNAFRKHCQS